MIVHVDSFKKGREKSKVYAVHFSYSTYFKIVTISISHYFYLNRHEMSDAVAQNCTSDSDLNWKKENCAKPFKDALFGLSGGKVISNYEPQVIKVHQWLVH